MSSPSSWATVVNPSGSIPTGCSRGGSLRDKRLSGGQLRSAAGNLSAPLPPCDCLPMAQTIDEELADLRARSLLRKLREIDSPQQPALEFAGKKLVNFSSNDYLGLATEPVLREAAKAAIDQYGV